MHTYSAASSGKGSPKGFSLEAKGSFNDSGYSQARTRILTGGNSSSTTMQNELKFDQSYDSPSKHSVNVNN